MSVCLCYVFICPPKTRSRVPSSKLICHMLSDNGEVSLRSATELQERETLQEEQEEEEEVDSRLIKINCLVKRWKFFGRRFSVQFVIWTLSSSSSCSCDRLRWHAKSPRCITLTRESVCVCVCVCVCESCCLSSNECREACVNKLAARVFYLLNASEANHSLFKAFHLAQLMSAFHKTWHTTHTYSRHTSITLSFLLPGLPPLPHVPPAAPRFVSATNSINK